MSTNVSIFTCSCINRENILKKISNKKIFNSSVQIENLVIDGINLNLWLQPQFKNIETNKKILTDFVNLEKSDDFIVLFVFTLEYGRITETFVNEIKILKEFFNKDISKIQFVYYLNEFEEFSSKEKLDIKELISKNINCNIEENIEKLNSDIYYVFDTNNIKKYIYDTIININNLKRCGMNKMIEPHIAFYGADNVFDDRLLTSSSRDI